MKQLIFLSLLFPVLLNAQPVIDFSVFPPDGTEVIRVSCDAPDPQSDVKGEDVTWDFSDISCSQDVWRFTFDSTDQSPIADNFPGANKFTQALISGEEIDIFYTINEESWSYSGLQIFGAIIHAQNQAREELLKFPTSYEDTWTSEFNYINQDNDISEGTATYTVDGFGTLILPSGTFNNVIRVYSQRTSQNMFTLETYTYYSSEYYDRLLHIMVDDESNYQVNPTLVTDSDNISINEQIRIYPNPISSGQLMQIEFNNASEVIIKLSSIKGRLLAREENVQFTNNKFNWHFDKNLGHGLYILSIQTRAGSYSEKIIIE